MTQIIAMAKRLQEVEQANADLERALESEKSSHGEKSADDATRLDTIERRVASGDQASDPSSSVQHFPSIGQSSSSVMAVTEQEKLVSDLSLDENGKVCEPVHPLDTLLIEVCNLSVSLLTRDQHSSAIMAQHQLSMRPRH